MSKPFAVGDRVNDIALGRGVIIQINPIPGLQGYHKVLFDEIPPVEYNMGRNPVLQPEGWLTKIGADTERQEV